MTRPPEKRGGLFQWSQELIFCLSIWKMATEAMYEAMVETLPNGPDQDDKKKSDGCNPVN